jgi:excisionase family DNA binding protein
MTEMNHYLEQERKIAELQKRVTSLESLCFQSKPVLNLEEASIYLGISSSMLYKMTHAGKIDFYNPEGKLIFFEKESLLNWARKNKVKSDETTQAEAELKLRELNVGN